MLQGRVPGRAGRAVLVLVGLCLLPVASLAQDSAQVSALELEIPRGKGEACVEPTGVMRKRHMEFLFHQRDATVHQGIRTKKHSLNECVACHVQQDAQQAFIPINDDGQFCEVCHGFASVKIDCFECHASQPAVADGEPMTLDELEALISSRLDSDQ